MVNMLQWILSLLLGSLQVSTSVPGAIKALQEIRDTPAARGHPDALAAYLEFQRAATTVLGRMQLILALGTPPPLPGALWTWPIAIRALRSTFDDSNALAITVGRVQVLGSSSEGLRKGW